MNKIGILYMVEILYYNFIKCCTGDNGDIMGDIYILLHKTVWGSEIVSMKTTFKIYKEETTVFLFA